MHMRALFIGGTGTISLAITKQFLAAGHELYLLNRGNRQVKLEGHVHYLNADIYQESDVLHVLGNLTFDVVAQFIAFEPEHIARDYRLFKNRTKQYLFISSASAYQKPLSHYEITESTPLANPYWEYSRNKIACEELLMKLYREERFPITIVRPSHTYDERSIPTGLHGDKGSYAVIKRMLEGKPVIIHGDGTSLWTLTHNQDFAKGFIGLMDNVHAIGESVQITSDESLTWNQIYGCIAKNLGVELNAVYVSSAFLAAASGYDVTGSLIGDKANTVVFDNSKLKRLVPDFVATTRFDQGVKASIAYVMSHKECQQEDPVFDAWCDAVIEEVEESAARLNAKFKSLR